MPPVTNQPDIFIGGIRIMEPVIALTGLLIFALCLYAFLRLRPQAQISPPARLIRVFFLFMMLSSLVGPFLGHAFSYTVGIAGKAGTWVFSLLSMTALAQAAIAHARPLLPAGLHRYLTLANILGLIAGLSLLTVFRNHTGMEVHAAFAMLGLIAPLEIYVYRKRRDPGSRLLLWSILLTIISGLPIWAKWSPSVWFTYFDVAHVLLLGSLMAILLAAEQMQWKFAPE